MTVKDLPDESQNINNSAPQIISFTKGGGGMKKRQIKIHCVYQNGEKTVSDILMESFRLYLRRILAG